MHGRRTVRRGLSGRDEKGRGVVRILLCDDHVMFREGIVDRLRYRPNLELVGEAGNGAKAVELARELRPDVVVMDLEMPGMGGFEAIARILREDREARVLVLSGHASDANVLGALEEGAVGYVLKGSPSTELFHAIEKVAAGERYIPPELASRLVFLLQDSSYKGLTEREVRVLRLIAEGKKDKEIARSLGQSLRTIRRDVTRLYEKLGASNRAQAIALASRRGLIPSGER
jgi:DNA-binding NarL/FixJ family response regulator